MQIKLEMIKTQLLRNNYNIPIVYTLYYTRNDF